MPPARINLGREQLIPQPSPRLHLCLQAAAAWALPAERSEALQRARPSLSNARTRAHMALDRNVNVLHRQSGYLISTLDSMRLFCFTRHNQSKQIVIYVPIVSQFALIAKALPSFYQRLTTDRTCREVEKVQVFPERGVQALGREGEERLGDVVSGGARAVVFRQATLKSTEGHEIEMGWKDGGEGR